MTSLPKAAPPSTRPGKGGGYPVTPSTVRPDSGGKGASKSNVRVLTKGGDANGSAPGSGYNSRQISEGSKGGKDKGGKDMKGKSKGKGKSDGKKGKKGDGKGHFRPDG